MSASTPLPGTPLRWEDHVEAHDFAAAADYLALVTPHPIEHFVGRMRTTGDKFALVLIANRLTIAGMAVLAVALVGVVVLVGDVMFPTAVVVVIGLLAAAMLIVTWAVLPLRERLHQLRLSPQPPA
ncbi:MAG TPA: DUF6328 family protein [Solirubrobacteraceae bacterium]|jgi:hypothetical protein|nr:DUF6328 family protein [Solirubrobacteraceae bacterium]